MKSNTGWIKASPIIWDWAPKNTTFAFEYELKIFQAWHSVFITKSPINFDDLPALFVFFTVSWLCLNNNQIQLAFLKVKKIYKVFFS